MIFKFMVTFFNIILIFCENIVFPYFHMDSLCNQQSGTAVVSRLGVALVVVFFSLLHSVRFSLSRVCERKASVVSL